MTDPIVASSADLPGSVAAALAAPEAGQRLVIEAADIPFSVLAWGDPAARPLVLLHGVTASAAIWWRVAPALAATGRRVLAPDLPGHGRTGHWSGRHRFADMAQDVAAWIREAGVDRPDLQVIGHSYGAVVGAHLPAAGIHPATLVLLDPPSLPHSLMARQVEDTTERAYDDLDEAIAAVTVSEPTWSAGDVRAKAEALTEIDEAAARAVLLDNGDWDAGLSGLADPAAANLDIWVVKGEQATGSYLPDAALPAFVARLGADHILTIKDGAHSPQRMLPEATVVAFLRALD
ncbi:MAG: alpha/beta fold hydrolase [Candidatus Limnocylindrales bacterium]